MQVKNTIAVIVTAWVLAGCGGGGGGSTPPPASVTQTVTCPNGTSKTGTGATTSAALDAATAQCAVPLLVSVTPADKSVVAPPTVVATTTDSTLDASSLTTANVTLKAGTTSVAGTVSADGTKGFKFTPSATLLFGQLYTFAATVRDTLGKVLSVNTTFTTASIQCVAPQVPNASGTSCEAPPAKCTAPAMLNSVNTCISPPATTGYTWNNVMKVWVADIGLLVTGANTLPSACIDIGDACWLTSAANGTIKFVKSDVIETGFNTRPIVFAFFLASDGNYNTKAMYADVLATSPSANSKIINGGGPSVITDIKGSTLGVKETYPAYGCYEKVYNGGGFSESKIACPI